MIKLTSLNGEDLIFISPGEIALVWEGNAKEHDARANAMLRLRPFSWEARGVLVKETPAEVAALIEEALGAADAGTVGMGLIGPTVLLPGDAPNFENMLRAAPGWVSFSNDGLKAWGTVIKGAEGWALVRFTLIVAWDPTTAAFDGWDKRRVHA